MKTFYESRVVCGSLSAKIDGPFEDIQEAKRSANEYYDGMNVAAKTPVYVLEIKKEVVFKREPMGEVNPAIVV